MRAGESIRNNQTGETLIMLVNEEENGGARQLYEVHLPPRRPSPPLHYHLAFAETFQVVEGALDMYLGRERNHVVVHPEEKLTAEIGQLHTFANERDTPAVITIETKPAGGVVRAFQLAYGVANDGGAARDGLPRNPIIRLVFIRMSEGFLPRVPLIVQKAVLGVAAFVARITGIEKRLRRYLR
jgi:mannose-6-phosphate isomerase-like protein (cupin superfamily)